MSHIIPVNTKLAAAHKGKDSPLHTMISGKTRCRLRATPSLSGDDMLWTAEWWGLNRSTVFAKFDPAMQRAALRACNRAMLNEAYFIEKSGLTYTAKMVLLAESTDAAQLYALIGADEATHLAWIEPFVESEDRMQPHGVFLAFLSNLIEESNPQLLVYLVQVILEGWGLDHYGRLAEGCQNPALAEAFRAILKDEVLHHRSGVVLHDHQALSDADYKMLTESLNIYAEMARVGPQCAIGALDRVAEGLTLHEIEELMAALDYPNESSRKLALLHGLMRRPGMENIVDKMAEADCFIPLATRGMAQYYLAHR